MKTANLRMRTLGIMGLLLMIIFFTSILGYFDADVGLKTKCVTLTIVYTTCIIIWVSETHRIVVIATRISSNIITFLKESFRFQCLFNDAHIKMQKGNLTYILVELLSPL